MKTLLLLFLVMVSTAWPSQQAIDGHWLVKMIRCNGEAPSAATRSLFENPNSISVLIDGDTGAFIDVINGCQITIPLRFELPASDRLDAIFNGPISCLPAACDPRCGLDLNVVVPYEIRVRKGTMFWRSLDATDDNCVRGGQSSPVFYKMIRHTL